VSTASRVPETWGYEDDDPQETLVRTGRIHLLASAFTRFRRADGTSHSRSLAFATSLVLVQGIVVLVGFAAAFGQSGVTSTIVETIRSAVPGPASDVLAEAVRQANRVGSHNRFLLLTIGLLGLLITSTTAMGQMERGLNRIYGIEQDRPTGRKYVLALVLTITVGTGLGIAFLMLGFGRSIGSSWGHEARVAWEILRWPIGLALIAVCLAAILAHSPNRQQPGRSWLAFGSGVAVVLWALSTIGLALAFRLASNFGQTYGPLAGIVALQIWTFLSAFSIFFGVAVAAELEAIRAGAGSRAAARPEPTAAPARASLQG
jgi:YihY family inner membrane protein